MIEYKNVEYFDRMGITQGVLEAAWGVVRESTSGVDDVGGRERVAGESKEKSRNSLSLSRELRSVFNLSFRLAQIHQQLSTQLDS